MDPLTSRLRGEGFVETLYKQRPVLQHPGDVCETRVMEQLCLACGFTQKRPVLLLRMMRPDDPLAVLAAKIIPQGRVHPAVIGHGFPGKTAGNDDARVLHPQLCAVDGDVYLLTGAAALANKKRRH